ncbi:MAG: hypothetical protein E6Q62_09010 [Nitrosomonas sp.]|nr:MAG: hypothetical protein E6Q62_09010 [Nitrosomonas sp.]
MVKCIFVGLLLFFISVMVMAHEGQPNMGFAWRDGKIEIDIRRQGRVFGQHTAFVIPFTDALSPYRMGDSGFTGIEFDQGGILGYQTESTLLKWSNEQSQWIREGFAEQLVISRLSDENIVTDKEGKGLQGFLEKLTNSSNFEAHAIFRIQKPDGSSPDDGAYMVFISMLGVDESGEQILYKPSVPFALVFHINAQKNFDSLALSQALNVVPEVKLNEYSRMDALFDWAESRYGQLFPHQAESRFIFGYYARCYDNSVCIGSKDSRIYTAGGILGDITEQGLIEDFYSQAGL